MKTLKIYNIIASILIVLLVMWVKKLRKEYKRLKHYWNSALPVIMKNLRKMIFFSDDS